MAVRAPNPAPAKADFQEKIIPFEFAFIGAGWATMRKRLAVESGTNVSQGGFPFVNSTGRRGFAQIPSVSKVGANHSRRKEELLAKLEKRSISCPGLYPVRTQEDFLRLARDHAQGGDESVCQVLEEIWRRPDEAVQINAQSLIRRGMGWRDEEKGKSSEA